MPVSPQDWCCPVGGTPTLKCCVSDSSACSRVHGVRLISRCLAFHQNWQLEHKVADTLSVCMCLRGLLSACKVPHAEAFTSHSLKATMLAWSRMVLAGGRDMRQQQGHHKLDMAALYARDDTVGALRLQLQVERALLQGWRPLTCQMICSNCRLHRYVYCCITCFWPFANNFCFG